MTPTRVPIATNADLGLLANLLRKVVHFFVRRRVGRVTTPDCGDEPPPVRARRLQRHGARPGMGPAFAQRPQEPDQPARGVADWMSFLTGHQHCRGQGQWRDRAEIAAVAKSPAVGAVLCRRKGRVRAPAKSSRFCRWPICWLSGSQARDFASRLAAPSLRPVIE